jgi:hypothetical protein
VRLEDFEAKEEIGEPAPRAESEPCENNVAEQEQEQEQEEEEWVGIRARLQASAQRTLERKSKHSL